jgi:hypothetical protein
MDALATIITTYPIPTLLVIAGVVLLGGLMRGRPRSRGGVVRPRQTSMADWTDAR